MVRMCIERDATITRLQQERDNLEDALKHAEQHVDAVCQERDTATREAKALRDRRDCFIKRNDRLHERLETAYQEAEELREEVGRLRALALDELAAESQRLGLYEAPAQPSADDACHLIGGNDGMFCTRHRSEGVIDGVCEVANAEGSRRNISTQLAVLVGSGSLPLEKPVTPSADDVERAREIPPMVAMLGKTVQQIYLDGIAQGRAGMREEAAHVADNYCGSITSLTEIARTVGINVVFVAEAIRTIPIDTPTGQGDDTTNV